MWNSRKADWYYGLSRWGSGYFSIQNGHLIVRPLLHEKGSIDVYELLQDVLKKYKLRTPILFRFPQIISSQIRKIIEAFDFAKENISYKGVYRLAYPMKVNQRKHVIDAVLSHEFASKGRVGLETGSKAELAIAISRNPPFIVCNGFMDEWYVRMALLASALGENIYLVINQFADTRVVIDEWGRISDILNERGIKFSPSMKLGIRLRLHPTGGGKWEKSGGEAARFGLKTYEIMDAVEMLDKAKLLKRVELLHFHLGSQIPGLKGIVDTVKEGMVVARDLDSIGVPVRVIDLGGGLPIDYDGTRSPSECSASYDVTDYADSVISTLAEMCDRLGMPHMDVMSESGRYITAHHAFLVTEIRSVMKSVIGDIPSRGDIPGALAPVIYKKVAKLFDLFDSLRKMKPTDSYLDIYQEAYKIRNSLVEDFRNGKIHLSLMAVVDRLFFHMIRIVRELATKDYERIDLSFKHIVSRIEEFAGLIALAPDKYLGNFSLFTSAVDVWGVDQIFPIVPIARLNEKPTNTVFIEDITCDSDGEISRFQWQRYGLNLHELNDATYYIAIMMVGAYQEALATRHNLLGNVNAVSITVVPNGHYKISIREEEKIKDMLIYAETDMDEIKDAVIRMINEKEIDEEFATVFIDYFQQFLSSSTYLEGDL